MKKTYVKAALLLIPLLLTGCSGGTGGGISEALNSLRDALFADPTWQERWFVSTATLTSIATRLNWFAGFIALLGLVGVIRSSVSGNKRGESASWLAIVFAGTVPWVPKLVTQAGRAVFFGMPDPLTLPKFADAGGWLTKDLNLASLYGTINFVQRDLPNLYQIFMWFVSILIIWNLVEVAIHGNGKSLLKALVWLLAYAALPYFIAGTLDVYAGRLQGENVAEAILKGENLQFRFVLIAVFAINMLIAWAIASLAMPAFDVPTLITVFNRVDKGIQGEQGKQVHSSETHQTTKTKAKSSDSHIGSVVAGLASGELIRQFVGDREPEDHEANSSKKKPSAEDINAKFTTAEEARDEARDAKTAKHGKHASAKSPDVITGDAVSSDTDDSPVSAARHSTRERDVVDVSEATMVEPSAVSEWYENDELVNSSASEDDAPETFEPAAPSDDISGTVPSPRNVSGWFEPDIDGESGDNLGSDQDEDLGLVNEIP